MLNKAYTHLCKHYTKYSFVANSLIAISMAGLSLLGLLTQTLTMTYLIGWGILFALMFGLGKLLDQEIDDLDKVRKHECTKSVRKPKK
jgi:hypothetical protein